MEFKLILEGDRPTSGDLVLAAETPLEGVAFMEAVGQTLRRSIDHIARCRHTTLGALATYDMTVPQSMAIESGKYTESNRHIIIAENDLLSHYIFYIASVDYKATGRPCYPYMNSEARLVSMIDELQFLADWAGLGYPDRVRWDGEKMADGTFGWNQSAGSGSSNNGGKGCDGCTCGKEHCDSCHEHGHCDHEHHMMHHDGCYDAPPPPDCGCHVPPPPPHSHHHHGCLPGHQLPPKPPVIGNPSVVMGNNIGTKRPGDLRPRR